MTRCEIEECGRPSRSRGWCEMHYARFRRHGDPNIRLQGSPPKATPRECALEGCTVVGKVVKGFCPTHYRRLWEHGDAAVVLHRQIPDPEEAFQARTQWNEETGCLEWTGALSSTGYGNMYLDGKFVHSHRFAWERDNDPIPEGLWIDHICHNRACVNVDHLRLSTRNENQRNRKGANSQNLTGFRNVHITRSGTFEVRVSKNGKVHLFGRYGSVEEAVLVAEQARKDLFGEFAGKG